MRIAEVHVRGFRCIADLKVSFDDLTALVGSGGVGKSAFLRAIEWFFDGGDLDEGDLHRHPDGTAVDEVIVAVTFVGLDDPDREVLRKYAEGDSTTLTRSWKPEEGTKLSGTALVYPAFAEVREGEGANEQKKRYREIFETRGEELGLPDPASRIDEVLANMERWERENPERCEPRTESARHLLGYTGTPFLNDRFDYVLVGATTEAAEEFGGARGSALDRLLSTVKELDSDTEEEIASLQSDVQRQMRELISTARADELDRIATSITERVQEYVPGTSVQLTDIVAPLRRPDVSVLARVSYEGGHPTEVARQGHGLQRALVIAVLHELADSFALETPGDTQAMAPRSLMLAVEEPELYQHPLQARALAATLSALATKGRGDSGRSVQVTYSSHSEHFVRPALFEDLRLFRRNQHGQSTSVAADRSDVRSALERAGFDGELGGKVERTLSVSLGEAVFARGVVLCEGSSDAAVITAVAEREGGFNRDGIAVATCWGKDLIPIACAILQALAIPTYVLFDADAGLAERLEQSDKTEEQRAAQVEAVAAKNRRLLALCGEEAVDWPPEQARERCANFADRLESYLRTSWPELLERCDQVGKALGMPAKSAEAYRQAVAEMAETPALLNAIVERVRARV